MRTLFSTILFLFIAIAPAAVAAETDGDRAVASGTEGLRQFAAGNYAAAYEHFELAEELSHSPVFVLHMARAKLALGEIPAARALYGRIVSEPLTPQAPAPWGRAQAAAARELETLPVEEAEAESVRPALPRETTPSDALTREPLASSGPARTSGAGTEWRSADESACRWAALATIGVGASGLAIGSATGLAALKRTEDIRRVCDGERCPPREDHQVESARDLARASTWSFAIGGSLIFAGVTWLLFQSEPLASVEVGFGPASIVARSSF